MSETTRFRAVSRNGDDEIVDPPCGVLNKSDQNLIKTAIAEDWATSLAYETARTVSEGQIDADNFFPAMLSKELHNLPNWQRLADTIQREPVTCTVLADTAMRELTLDSVITPKVSNAARNLTAATTAWQNALNTRTALRSLLKGATPSEKVDIRERLKPLKEEVAKQNAIAQNAAKVLKTQFDSDSFFQAVDDWAKRMIESMGCVGSVMSANTMSVGFGNGMSLDQKVAVTKDHVRLVEKLSKNPRLLEIMEEIGRMRTLYDRRKRERCKHGVDEVVDVVKGDRLDRSLPSELLPAMKDSTRGLFVARMMDKGLMQYAIEGRQPVKKGPIILVVDQSGSMSGVKELWSKGLMGGVLKAAADQKRDAYVIAFSTSTRLYSFPKEKPVSPDTLLKVLEEQLGGGTDLAKPINEAFSIIETSSSGSPWQRADILFISDGDGHISDDHRKKILANKVKHGVQIQTIILKECDSDSADCLAPISNSVCQVQPSMLVGDTKLAGDLFEKLAT